MQKLRIIALTEDRKALLEKLQRLGTLQPEFIPEDELAQLESPDTSAQQTRFEEAIRRIDSIDSGTILKDCSGVLSFAAKRTARSIRSGSSE